MPRVVKKPLERRAEIIKAARQLFHTKEYEKMTLQHLMDQLGIAKGTIYHYFKSKEELLEAVIEEIVREHLEKTEVFLKNIKGTALKKIELLIEKGKDTSLTSVLEELHKKGNEAMHTRLLAATLIKQAPIFAMLIRQGCEEGVFNTDTPLECAELILSSIQFLTDRGIYPWSDDDLVRRIGAFPLLIEQLLRAPPGSFSFLTQLA